MKSFTFSRYILITCFAAVAVILSVFSFLSPLAPYPEYDGHRPSEWPIAVERMLEPVALFPENTKHYAMATSLGVKEWRALYPPGNGVIELGPSQQRFAVAMFHQLQCLDIIREEIVAPANGSSGMWDEDRRWALTNHCMNYLRQMLLCHSNTALESVRSDDPPAIVDLTRSRYACRDWTVLYDREVLSEVAL